MFLCKSVMVKNGVDIITSEKLVDVTELYPKIKTPVKVSQYLHHKIVYGWLFNPLCCFRVRSSKRLKFKFLTDTVLFQIRCAKSNLSFKHESIRKPKKSFKFCGTGSLYRKH